jgi:hypothetical protein
LKRVKLVFIFVIILGLIVIGCTIFHKTDEESIKYGSLAGQIKGCVEGFKISGSIVLKRIIDSTHNWGPFDQLIDSTFKPVTITVDSEGLIEPNRIRSGFYLVFARGDVYPGISEERDTVIGSENVVVGERHISCENVMIFGLRIAADSTSLLYVRLQGGLNSFHTQEINPAEHPHNLYKWGGEIIPKIVKRGTIKGKIEGCLDDNEFIDGMVILEEVNEKKQNSRSVIYTRTDSTGNFYKDNLIPGEYIATIKGTPYSIKEVNSNKDKIYANEDSCAQTFMKDILIIPDSTYTMKVKLLTK